MGNGMIKVPLTDLDMPGIKSLAEAFSLSGLFPDLVKEGTSEENEMAKAIVKIVAGQELSLPPVYSMQNFYIIRGRLSMAAETMGLLLKRKGEYDYKVIEHTDTKCSIEFYHNGSMLYLSTFTIEDAKRAGIYKPDSGWYKYPRAMLFSRAMSQGSRIVAPHLMAGIHTAEEMESIEGTEELAAPAPEKRKGKAKKDAPKEELKMSASETDTFTPGADKTFGELVESDEIVEGEAVEVAKDAEVETAPALIEPKRDPDSLKTISAMTKALFDDYGLQPAEVYKELNVKSGADLSKLPADYYRQVAAVHIARGD